MARKKNTFFDKINRVLGDEKVKFIIKCIIIFTTITLFFRFIFIKHHHYLLSLRKKDQKLQYFLRLKQEVLTKKEVINRDNDEVKYFFNRNFEIIDEFNKTFAKNEIKEFNQQIETIAQIKEEDFFQNQNPTWRDKQIKECLQIIAKAKVITDKFYQLKLFIKEQYDSLTQTLKTKTVTLQQQRLNITEYYDYYHDLIFDHKNKIFQPAFYNLSDKAEIYYRSDDTLIDEMLKDILFFHLVYFRKELATWFNQTVITINNQTIMTNTTNINITKLMTYLALNESINFFFNVTKSQYVNFGNDRDSDKVLPFMRLTTLNQLLFKTLSKYFNYLNKILIKVSSITGSVL